MFVYLFPDLTDAGLHLCLLKKVLALYERQHTIYSANQLMAKIHCVYCRWVLNVHILRLSVSLNDRFSSHSYRISASKMITALILITLIKIVTTQQNVFYNPASPGTDGDYSDNAVWVTGSQQELEWSTSYNNMSLVLWQQGANNSEDILSK